jgi:hypothetical protein
MVSASNLARKDMVLPLIELSGAEFSSDVDASEHFLDHAGKLGKMCYFA